MSRYSDPRRPTSNGPKTISAGRIVMRRIDNGRYVHTTARMITYEVVQIDNGRWVWAKVGNQADDSYETKREACAALQEWIYGTASFELSYTSYEY